MKCRVCDRVDVWEDCSRYMNKEEKKSVEEWTRILVEASNAEQKPLTKDSWVFKFLETAKEALESSKRNRKNETINHDVCVFCGKNKVNPLKSRICEQCAENYVRSWLEAYDKNKV